MNPYQAYKAGCGDVRPRIQVLLELYDGTIQILETALGALHNKDTQTARAMLTRASAVISGMAASVDLNYGDLPKFFLRLYDFILHSLTLGDASNIEPALRVLRILREGFEGIRSEALQMERQGTIPPINASPSLLTVV